MTHRLRRGLLAAVLALTIFTGGLLSACGSDGQKSRSYAPAGSVPRVGSGGIRESSGPPSGLSRRGRVLWQFEALLHDTFGSDSVCATGRRTSLNFTGGPVASSVCKPLAVWSPYFYVFAYAHHSAFHISDKKRVEVPPG